MEVKNGGRWKVEIAGGWRRGGGKACTGIGNGGMNGGGKINQSPLTQESSLDI